VFPRNDSLRLWPRNDSLRRFAAPRDDRLAVHLNAMW
jgi:hypothetical protein